MAKGGWKNPIAAENGKKGGRPKLFASKLSEALVRKAEEEAEVLSSVLLEKAKAGDLPAIKEMFDRALGKALQNVDMTTNGKELPTPIYGGASISGHVGDTEAVSTEEED